jgi:hypothetical protein
VAALASLASVVPHHTTSTRHVAPRVFSRRVDACSNSNPRACIIEAAHQYHQSVADAEHVAFCESTMNPSATNGADDGLFQIAPETYATTPYRGQSIWLARWNSLAAMWLWATGHKNEWSCQ